MSITSFFKNTFFILANPIAGIFSKHPSILMYHSISTNKAFFTVKPELFEKQLKHLTSKKYNVISLSRLILTLKNKEKIPPKTVVLTFDDGYKDNFTEASFLLLKYDVPATVFIATDYIGKTMTNSEGIAFPILNIQEIKSMIVSNMIEFMPHSQSHKTFNTLIEREAIKEAEESRKVVQDITGKIAPIFAYPKGKTSTEIVFYLAREGNWLGAVTVKEGTVREDDNLFMLKRNAIDSATTFAQFKGKINGAIDWYEALKRLFSRLWIVKK